MNDECNQWQLAIYISSRNEVDVSMEVQHSLFFQHHFWSPPSPKRNASTFSCYMVYDGQLVSHFAACFGRTVSRSELFFFFFKTKTEQSNQLEDAKTLIYTESCDRLLIRIGFRCLGWMKVQLGKDRVVTAERTVVS